MCLVIYGMRPCILARRETVLLLPLFPVVIAVRLGFEIWSIHTVLTTGKIIIGSYTDRTGPDKDS
jgi:hypothetical protein